MGLDNWKEEFYRSIFWEKINHLCQQVLSQSPWLAYSLLVFKFKRQLFDLVI
jgi:hypothetical protein